MTSRRIGLWLVLMALLVNAPRLVLAYLRADGLALWPSVEGGMLAVTGIATGVVLSGGGAYIAHVLAGSAKRGVGRCLLATIWLAMLLFAVVLLAPMLVASIRATDMVRVLPDGRWQWAWAICAVLAVEVLAAGAMLAEALSTQPQQASATSGPSRASRIADALANRVVAQLSLAPGATGNRVDTPVALIATGEMPRSGREPGTGERTVAGRQSERNTENGTQETPGEERNAVDAQQAQREGPDRTVVLGKAQDDGPGAGEQDTVATGGMVREFAGSVSTRERVFVILDQDPEIGTAQLATALGISESAARSYRSQWRRSRNATAASHNGFAEGTEE